MGSRLSRAALFAFNYGSVWMRRFIVRQLARRDRSLAGALIPAAIRDSDLDVRLATLELVSAHRRWQDLEILSVALHDRHAAVRAAAAHVLGQCQSVRAGDCVQQALRDPHPDVRAAAAWALGQIPTLRFSEALENALADGNSSVRACAAQALGRVGRAEAIIPLRAMAARDPVYPNRRLARQAIEGVERRTASKEEKRRQARVELVEALLDSRSSEEERERAKVCLIRIGGKSSIPILNQALRATNDARLHLHVVEILATLPPCKQLQKALIGCLHHISPPVRRRAIVALGDTGDEEAIYPLSVVAREGEDPTQMLQLEDSRLALEAVQEIKKRARKSARPM